MAAPPLRTELSSTYPTPSNAAARVGFGKLWDYVTGLLGSTGNAAEARAALGAMGYAGGTLTGVLNEAKGADIAASGTLNLSTATGNLVDVTGGTTITAITLLEGAERTVRFTSSPTITHGASLILPGAANISAAAGDYAVFRGYAAGVVRCVAYTKASGMPIAMPAASLTVVGAVELATSAETITGTATSLATTPAGVAAAIAATASGLGVGQTWHDHTSTRNASTVYTNSHGAPIQLSIWLSQGEVPAYLWAGPAGTATMIIGLIGGDLNNTSVFNPIIPNGWGYKIVSSAVITAWMELY